MESSEVWLSISKVAHHLQCNIDAYPESVSRIAWIHGVFKPEIRCNKYSHPIVAACGGSCGQLKLVKLWSAMPWCLWKEYKFAFVQEILVAIPVHINIVIQLVYRISSTACGGHRT